MFKIIKDNRGASMVEFALVAPLLFVLIFGIIEFAVVVYDKAVINAAAREGARWVAAFYIDPNTAQPVHPSCSDVQNHVTSSILATYPLISLGGSSQVQGCCGNGCTPSPSWPSTHSSFAYTTSNTYISDGDSVTVQYNYNFLVFSNVIKLLKGTIPSILNLKSTALMRDENQDY